MWRRNNNDRTRRRTQHDHMTTWSHAWPNQSLITSRPTLFGFFLLCSYVRMIDLTTESWSRLVPSDSKEYRTCILGEQEMVVQSSTTFSNVQVRVVSYLYYSTMIRWWTDSTYCTWRSSGRRIRWCIRILYGIDLMWLVLGLCGRGCMDGCAKCGDTDRWERCFACFLLRLLGGRWECCQAWWLAKVGTCFDTYLLSFLHPPVTTRSSGGPWSFADWRSSLLSVFTSS